MSSGRSRVGYLDGLRGIAAMQVVLFHYALAFNPSFLRGPGRLIDGDFAVFIFFIMSGFVLTSSFEREANAVVAGIERRIIRLGIPSAAACLFAYAVQVGWPLDLRRIFEMAGTLPHMVHYCSPRTLAMALFDASGLTLVVGYANTTLFGFLAPLLPQQYMSVDGVIWSLHIELWGSALVMGLVWFRARSQVLYFGFMAFCVAAVGGNALNLFLVGNLLSVVSRTQLHARLGRLWLRSTLGCALLLVGELVWLRPDGIPGFWRLAAVHVYQGVATPYAWFDWRVEFAAVLIFLAFLVAPLLRRPLTCRPALWLGRLSFPIYLIHLPILMTIGSGVFGAGLSMGSTAASIAALAVGLTLTLPAALALERWVDQPAIAAARRRRSTRAGSQGNSVRRSPDEGQEVWGSPSANL